MVTWTTYGSWLQGDKRGYVKDAEILPENDKLKSANKTRQKFQTVKLDEKQKGIARQAIVEQAKRTNQRIFALAVCSNHIHIVAGISEKTIEQAVYGYK